MPGGKGPGPSIKNPDQYEAIKKKLKAEHPNWPEGRLQEHAARISNSQHMNNFIRRKR